MRMVRMSGRGGDLDRICDRDRLCLSVLLLFVSRKRPSTNRTNTLSRRPDGAGGLERRHGRHRRLGTTASVVRTRLTLTRSGAHLDSPPSYSVDAVRQSSNLPPAYSPRSDNPDLPPPSEHHAVEGTVPPAVEPNGVPTTSGEPREVEKPEPADPVSTLPSDPLRSHLPPSSPSLSPTTMRPPLRTLISSVLPSDGSPIPSEIVDAVRSCMEHISAPQGASEAQTGAFLAALSAGVWVEQPRIIAVCAKVMRHRSVQLDWGSQEDVERCDIVGTGGDGKDTFNVSTTAAIVVAGLEFLGPAPSRRSVQVVKHGNRASSSTSGSADLLMSLSIPLTSLPPSALPPLTGTCPFTFLFAPLFHPALAALAPLRKDLGFPTIFNLLGPLVNPSSPSRMVVGVPRKSLGRTYAEALGLLGVKRAWVVCGREGLDEVSIEGETDVWDLKEDGTIEEKTIAPETFGLTRRPLALVAGGSSSSDNARILERLLHPTDTPPTVPVPSDKLDAILDFVLLNAAALVLVSGRSDNPKDAVELCRKSIEQGAAWKALQGFRAGADKAVQAAGSA